MCGHCSRARVDKGREGEEEGALKGLEQALGVLDVDRPVAAWPAVQGLKVPRNVRQCAC